jgi:hypothetical protein
MPRIEILRALNQILTDLRNENKQLAEVNSNWADPPDPDKPAIRDTLNAIKTEAATTTRLADGMLLRLG